MSQLVLEYYREYFIFYIERFFLSYEDKIIINFPKPYKINLTQRTYYILYYLNQTYNAAISQDYLMHQFLWIKILECGHYALYCIIYILT
jgi:hypothetical protein